MLVRAINLLYIDMDHVCTTSALAIRSPLQPEKQTSDTICSTSEDDSAISTTNIVDVQQSSCQSAHQPPPNDEHVLQEGAVSPSRGPERGRWHGLS